MSTKGGILTDETLPFLNRGKSFTSCSWEEENFFLYLESVILCSILSYWYCDRQNTVSPVKRGNISFPERKTFPFFFFFRKGHFLRNIAILIFIVAMFTKKVGERVTDGTVCFLQKGEKPLLPEKRKNLLFCTKYNFIE